MPASYALEALQEVNSHEHLTRVAVRDIGVVIAFAVAALALAAATWANSPIGRGVMKTLLADGDDPEVRALVNRLVRKRGRGPIEIFERAIASGELDEEADVRMAMTVIAGTLSHRIVVENESVTPAFVKRLVRLVVDGLTAQAG